jgi:phosphoribosyl 1,2-cyclic phosphodiesterase
VRLKVFGARGSIPAPGPQTNRYGGNTPCVSVTLSDDRMLVLDAGTGIRTLGLELAGAARRIDILLTHLHLDHIQGLMFFAPLFNPDSEIVIWGPEAPDASLRDRVGRYISAPLSPVEIRELPCQVSFNAAPPSEWEIGPATVRAESVAHRGPTLGFRIAEAGSVLCYIPDHEPALGAEIESSDPEWISGFELAQGASLLIHDCQYADEEYDQHVGWGHSRLTDALAFAGRAEPERVLLFHHDPLHSDEELDVLERLAADRWAARGGNPGDIGLARESEEIALAAPSGVSAPGA